MAQLTNESRQLDKWLASQYEDVVEDTLLEEGIELKRASELFPNGFSMATLPQGTSPEYTSMDNAPFSSGTGDVNINKEKTKGAMSQALSELARVQNIRSVAGLKSKLKPAIKRVLDVAEKAGFKIEYEPLDDEPEEAVEPEIITEEPPQELSM